MRPLLRRPTALLTTTLATGLAVAASLALAAPAQAADATIRIDNGRDAQNAFVYLPLELSGTCTDAATTAVVTLSQGADTLDQVAVDVAADHTWSATLDPTDGDGGFANAQLECLTYAGGTAVGSTSLPFYLLTYLQVEVTANPTDPRIGSSLTITADCPAGTTEAEIVVATNEEGQNGTPPVLATAPAAADGSVTWTGVLAARSGLGTGPGAAVVDCGDEAFGFTALTIRAAAAPAADDTDANSATPEVLASTGTQGSSLGALAGLLLLAGLVLRLAATGHLDLRRLRS